MENFCQTLVLEEQKRLTLTKVATVDLFTEERIRLTAATGKITLTGEKLKILVFNQSTGAFTCEGKITSATFAERKQNFIKRLFK